MTNASFTLTFDVGLERHHQVPETRSACLMGSDRILVLNGRSACRKATMDVSDKEFSLKRESATFLVSCIRVCTTCCHFILNHGLKGGQGLAPSLLVPIIKTFWCVIFCFPLRIGTLYPIVIHLPISCEFFFTFIAAWIPIEVYGVFILFSNGLYRCLQGRRLSP